MQIQSSDCQYRKQNDFQVNKGEHFNLAKIYQRKICLYDNWLKKDLSENPVTVKGVTQIKVNDKESLQTQEIFNDFEKNKLIKSVANPIDRYKYNNNGIEYRFVLNDFEDCRKIIQQEKILREQQNAAELRDKVFKCSLFVFQLIYPYTDFEINLIDGCNRYLELQGTCQDEDLRLYSKLIHHFSTKFQAIGIVLMPTSAKTLNTNLKS